jgi:signal transduction histidine kinase
LYFSQRCIQEEKLRRLNEELEQRVRARTRQLASVNEALVAEVTERRHTEHTLATSRRELQHLSARLLHVQEQERRRISRDLHDDINQRLAAVIIELDRFIRQPAASETADTPAMRTLQDSLVEISEDVRKLAYEYHPSILDDLGLAVALQRLTDDFTARTGITCTFTCDDDASVVTEDLATCLYRVAQESLANVSRHAGASRVEVSLVRATGGLALTVTDDGVGFDPDDTRDGRRGLGVISMKERVSVIDGTLEIVSKLGQGTRIRVLGPVPVEDA